MNDQCCYCNIRKFCYLEEPEEDWACNQYKSSEMDNVKRFFSFIPSKEETEEIFGTNKLKDFLGEK